MVKYIFLQQEKMYSRQEKNFQLSFMIFITKLVLWRTRCSLALLSQVEMA